MRRCATKDQYEDALKELLKKKQSGQKIEAPSEREPSKVVTDAACWAMHRTLVHMLIRKGLMTERALCDEVRAIYLAQREMLGEEGAAHLRAWMQQLGCTDIPQ